MLNYYTIVSVSTASSFEFKGSLNVVGSEQIMSSLVLVCSPLSGRLESSRPCCDELSKGRKI